MHGRRMRSAAAALAVALAAGLGGCAAGGPAGYGTGDSESAARQAARERVAELARDIGDTRPDDIDGFARAVVAASAPDAGGAAAGIELVGIRAVQSERLDEPFGSLAFRVKDAIETTGDAAAVVSCFEVAFDYYGKVGEWSTTDGVIDTPCPDGPPVTPPPDTTVRGVVAPNSREAVHSVLEQRLATGEPDDASDISRAIEALLTDPEGELQVAARPTVLVDQAESDSGSDGGTDTDRVGVALGGPDDCVLVKLEAGVVEDVRPAPVLLQPGELGCSPETALAAPELLRPPH